MCSLASYLITYWNHIVMTQSVLTKLIKELNEIDKQSDQNDPDYASRLLDVTSLLERYVIEISIDPSISVSKNILNEEELYNRTIKDLLSLTSQLTEVKKYLINKKLFIKTMKNKGDDIGSMNINMQFVSQLDFTLEHLINLIRFDDPNHTQWSVKNGYEFKSSGLTTGRFYFDQKKDS